MLALIVAVIFFTLATLGAITLVVLINMIVTESEDAPRWFYQLMWRLHLVKSDNRYIMPRDKTEHRFCPRCGKPLKLKLSLTKFDSLTGKAKEIVCSLQCPTMSDHFHVRVPYDPKRRRVVDDGMSKPDDPNSQAAEYQAANPHIYRDFETIDEIRDCLWAEAKKTPLPRGKPNVSIDIR